MPNQAAAWNYLYTGRPEMAEAQARRTIESFPDALQPHFVLGWAAWCQGKVSPIALVVLHAGLGDADAACEWLETACRLRGDLHWLFVKSPGLDPLRADPRLAALVHCVGVV